MSARSHGTIPLVAEAFLAHVEALAPEAWLALGDHEPLDHSALRTALLIRDAALSDRALDLDAWLVRDAVATLAWLAARRLGPLDRRDQDRLTSAQCRIERAAVTQLVSDALPARDLQALCSSVSGWLPSPGTPAGPLGDRIERAGLDAG